MNIVRKYSIFKMSLQIDFRQKSFLHLFKYKNRHMQTLLSQKHRIIINRWTDYKNDVKINSSKTFGITSNLLRIR